VSAPTRSTTTAPDGAALAVYRWDPEGAPRAVVLLVHGMGEHMGRYGHVAEALTDRGHLVWGHDHRAHGATSPPDADLGALGAEGWPALVDDVGVMVEGAHNQFGDLPVVVLGHSMGSFAVQQYLLDHSDRVDGVVLTGTGLLDQLEPGLDLDRPTDLSGFNAPFEPARTEYDWLSRDEDVVDAYIADPWCGFGLDADGTRAMFVAGRALADPQRLAGMRADLPVLVAVGALDPVGANGMLARMLVDRYRDAGLADVTLRVYEDARHEVLNETNRDEVIDDIGAWIDRVCGDDGGA
jgi:alpha-beta hydrolase superfamily lysophospholipase